MSSLKTPSKGVTTVVGKVLSSTFAADGKPGEAWPSALAAPIADGTNVSTPPMFGGNGPALEVAGTDTPKLGVGSANPTLHGGE